MIFSACLRPPKLQPERPVLTGISRRRETGFRPRIVVRGQAFSDRALILIHRSDEKESRQLFLQKFRGVLSYNPAQPMLDCSSFIEAQLLLF
jgi:hypothetical protein